MFSGLSLLVCTSKPPLTDDNGPVRHTDMTVQADRTVIRRFFLWPVEDFVTKWKVFMYQRCILMHCNVNLSCGLFFARMDESV